MPAMIAYHRAVLRCQPNASLFYRCQKRHLEAAQPSLPEVPACFPKDALVLSWQDTSIKIFPRIKWTRPSLFQKPTKYTATQRRQKKLLLGNQLPSTAKLSNKQKTMPFLLTFLFPNFLGSVLAWGTGTHPYHLPFSLPWPQSALQHTPAPVWQPAIPPCLQSPSWRPCLQGTAAVASVLLLSSALN